MASLSTRLGIYMSLAHSTLHQIISRVRPRKHLCICVGNEESAYRNSDLVYWIFAMLKVFLHVALLSHSFKDTHVQTIFNLENQKQNLYNRRVFQHMGYPFVIEKTCCFRINRKNSESYYPDCLCRPAFGAEAGFPKDRFLVNT